MTGNETDNFNYIVTKIKEGRIDSLMSEYGSMAAPDQEVTVWIKFFRVNYPLITRDYSDWPAIRIFIQLAAESSDKFIREAAENWIRKGNMNWPMLRAETPVKLRDGIVYYAEGQGPCKGSELINMNIPTGETAFIDTHGSVRVYNPETRLPVRFVHRESGSMVSWCIPLGPYLLTASRDSASFLIMRTPDMETVSSFTLPDGLKSCFSQGIVWFQEMSSLLILAAEMTNEPLYPGGRYTSRPHPADERILLRYNIDSSISGRIDLDKGPDGFIHMSGSRFFLWRESAWFGVYDLDKKEYVTGPGGPCFSDDPRRWDEWSVSSCFYDPGYPGRVFCRFESVTQSENGRLRLHDDSELNGRWCIINDEDFMVSFPDEAELCTAVERHGPIQNISNADNDKILESDFGIFVTDRPMNIPGNENRHAHRPFFPYEGLSLQPAQSLFSDDYNETGSCNSGNKKHAGQTMECLPIDDYLISVKFNPVEAGGGSMEIKRRDDGRSIIQWQLYHAPLQLLEATGINVSGASEFPWDIRFRNGRIEIVDPGDGSIISAWVSAYDFSACWSPDGRIMATAAAPNDTYSLFLERVGDNGWQKQPRKTYIGTASDLVHSIENELEQRPAYWQRIAAEFLENDKPHECLHALERACKLDSSLPHPLHLRALLKAEMKGVSRGSNRDWIVDEIAFIDADFSSGDPSPLAMKTLGELARRSMDYDFPMKTHETLDLLERCNRLSPFREPELLYLLGRFRFDHGNNFIAGKAVLEQCLTTSPAHSGARYILALCLALTGNISRAAEEFDLLENSNDMEQKQTLSTGGFQDQYESRQEGWLSSGIRDLLSRNEKTPALNLMIEYEKIARLNRPSQFFLYGWLLHNSGASARECLEKINAALELDPCHRNALYEKASIEASSGMTAKALEDISAYIETDERSDKAEDEVLGDPDFAALRDNPVFIKLIMEREPDLEMNLRDNRTGFIDQCVLKLHSGELKIDDIGEAVFYRIISSYLGTYRPEGSGAFHDTALKILRDTDRNSGLSGHETIFLLGRLERYSAGAANAAVRNYSRALNILNREREADQSINKNKTFRKNIIKYYIESANAKIITRDKSGAIEDLKKMNNFLRDETPDKRFDILNRIFTTPDFNMLANDPFFNELISPVRALKERERSKETERERKHPGENKTSGLTEL